jgi:hypothetical protein
MLTLRNAWTTLARLGVPLALAVCLVSPVSAQLRPHVGPHLGANFDSDDLLVGVHFGLPIVNRLEFTPRSTSTSPSSAPCSGSTAISRSRPR